MHTLVALTGGHEVRGVARNNKERTNCQSEKNARNALALGAETIPNLMPNRLTEVASGKGSIAPVGWWLVHVVLHLSPAIGLIVSFKALRPYGSLWKAGTDTQRTKSDKFDLLNPAVTKTAQITEIYRSLARRIRVLTTTL